MGYKLYNVMSIVNEWIETAQSVLMEPTDFFSSETRRDGFGFPIKFAGISIVIAAIFNTIGAGISTAIGTGFEPMALIGALLGSLIGGLIGLLIGASLIHIFVYLFGGKQGYKSTLAVLCFASATTPISAAASIIPILGGLISLAVGIYAIYLQIKGLEEFQSLSTGQAALSVILPVVVMAIIFIIIAVIAMLVGIAAFTGAEAFGTP